MRVPARGVARQLHDKIKAAKNTDLHVTATELNNTLDLTPFDDGAVETPALALLTSEQFEARRRPAARAARP